MKKNNRITTQKKIWCKIRYYQQLHDISDEELAKYLNVHTRTLRTYDKGAENLTLGNLDSFLYAVNLELSDLYTI